MRLLIPVIQGILIQDIFAISKWVSITVMSGGLLMMLFSLITSPFFAFRNNVLSGFLLNLLLTGTGCQLRFVRSDQPFCKRFPGRERHRLIVEVEEAPAKKGNGIRCLVSLRWVIKNSRCYKEDEKIIVLFRDSVLPSGWETGAVRIIESPLFPIRNAGVKPKGNAAGGFDYVAWCARRHIYARAFSGNDNGMIVFMPRGFHLRRQLSAAQDLLGQVCRRYLPSKERGGLLEALLIGYTRDLDADIMRAYSDAGVVHIIAISGLHLALIAELLQSALSVLGTGRRMRLMRLFVLLTVVWGYSLLTGASPSVLRSAFMFSFVLLAREFALQAPVYNALSASAFLLLCDDPFRLWDTGFQLSYAAVLSLVLFNPPIRNWFQLKNKLLTMLWQAAAVSLAAQVLTTPVSIWYFHRFPFYFLLTNLVAVPLSSAILLAGIALLVFSPVPPVARFLGYLLDAALRAMNEFVRYSNRLPGSAVSNIPIHFFQVILCYSLLYSFCRFAEKAEKCWLFAILLQICAFLVDGLNT